MPLDKDLILKTLGRYFRVDLKVVNILMAGGKKEKGNKKRLKWEIENKKRKYGGYMTI